MSDPVANPDIAALHIALARRYLGIDSGISDIPEPKEVLDSASAYFADLKRAGPVSLFDDGDDDDLAAAVEHHPSGGERRMS